MVEDFISNESSAVMNMPQKVRHYFGAFFMERKVKYDYAFKLECVGLVFIKKRYKLNK